MAGDMTQKEEMTDNSLMVKMESWFSKEKLARCQDSGG